MICDTMNSFIIRNLYSGGIITNYYCTSKCRHCLYACAPQRDKEYISKQMVKEVVKKIMSMGCYSIHIGGGEPMLDIPGLIKVAEVADEMGMSIEYVETNSSWYTNQEKAVEVLNELKNAGIRQLLVSISPFHNEHIAFIKQKAVINACREAGMQVFPWIMEFYPDLEGFDDQQTHALSEYQQKYGERYLQRIPSRYWTHLGGRAVYTFKEVLPLKPLDEILDNPGCSELTDTSHFHIDLYGNYVPGLCAGLAIKMNDLGNELSDEDYPILNILHGKGISGFLDYAVSETGFVPQEQYLNKCHLCNEIRIYLIKVKGNIYRELKPDGYYMFVKN